MKRREHHAVPPTRTQRAQLRRFTWPTGATKEQGEQFRANLARTVVPGTITVIAYRHEPWCPRVKTKVRYDKHGRPHDGHEGECACDPDVEALHCPDKESLDAACDEMASWRMVP